jgi:hypothetical protein
MVRAYCYYYADKARTRLNVYLGFADIRVQFFLNRVELTRLY